MSPQRPPYALLWLGAAATAGLLFGVVAGSDLVRGPLLGPPAPARYLSPRVAWTLVPVAVLALAVPRALRGGFTPRRYVLLACACALASAFLWGWQEPGRLFNWSDRIYRNTTTGYYTDTALFTSPTAVFREYEERYADLTPHGRTHPAGTIALFASTNELAEGLAAAAQRLGWTKTDADRELLGFQLQSWIPATLVLCIAPLWLVPLFGLTRRLAGERAAVAAVGLGALHPMLCLWVPLIDLTFPLLSAVTLYLFVRGVGGGGLAWTFLAGLAWCAALSLGYGFLGLLLPFALLWFLRAPRRELTGALRHAGVLALAVAAWLLIVRAALSYDALGAFRTSVLHHLRASEQRAYGTFLVWSPLTFLEWLGLPLVAGLARGLPCIRRETLLPIALVTLAAATVSGATRGEAERLWLPFLPLVLPAAAQTLARHDAVWFRLWLPWMWLTALLCQGWLRTG